MALEWDTEELTALRRAYASGTLRVSYEGKTVEYAGEADLLRRIRTIEAETAVAQGTARPSRSFARFCRG